MSFVPEGYLSFPDAAEFVVRKRTNDESFRGLTQQELLRLRAAFNQRDLAPAIQAVAGKAFVVPGELLRADADAIDQLGRRETLFVQAAGWLRNRLVKGEIAAQLHGEHGGIYPLPSEWWVREEFEEILRYGDATYGRVEGHIVIAEAVLLAALEGRSAAKTEAPREPQSRVNAGGRPPKYDYGWLGFEVANIMFNERKPPQTQAALITLLQERYQAQFGEAPDQTTLKPFARDVFKRLGLN